MSNNTSYSGHYEWKSEDKDPLIVVYNGMNEIVDRERECMCDTSPAMTKPIVSTVQNIITCTSWCPFCGATKKVTVDPKILPKLAPDAIWRLDADKIYEFVSRVNDLGYLPKYAGSDNLAWTFPQVYSDGTFSTNVFDITIGRGLTVWAPECYILRDDRLTNFDRKLLEEFDQLGSLGLLFPKKPAHANA